MIPPTPKDLADRVFRYAAERIGRDDITVDMRIYEGAFWWTITVDHHQYHWQVA